MSNQKSVKDAVNLIWNKYYSSKIIQEVNTSNTLLQIKCLPIIRNADKHGGKNSSYIFRE